MALISATIFPQSLGYQTRINVIIPQNQNSKKVLYLLHGLSDDSSAWLRYTRVESYANDRDFIVIMPEVVRSFYMDMAYGSQYFTYVSKELPEIVENLFNINHKRETTFVAGVSMGGYGSLRCGLSRPEFYAACASFSGVVNAARITEPEHNKQLPEVGAILGGNNGLPEEAYVKYLTKKVAKLPEKERPSIFLVCGDNDILIKDNNDYNELLQSLSLDFEYKQWPGGHTWDFWEQALPMALDFFIDRRCC